MGFWVYQTTLRITMTQRIRKIDSIIRTSRGLPSRRHPRYLRLSIDGSSATSPLVSKARVPIVITGPSVGMISEYVKPFDTERSLINRPSVYFIKRITSLVMVSDLKESDSITTQYVSILYFEATHIHRNGGSSVSV